MQQDGQPARDCDHGAFLPAFASVPSQLHAPSAQVAVDSSGAENVVRSLHQECSQVRIALYATRRLHLVLGIDLAFVDRLPNAWPPSLCCR